MAHRERRESRRLGPWLPTWRMLTAPPSARKLYLTSPEPQQPVRIYSSATPFPRPRCPPLEVRVPDSQTLSEAPAAPATAPVPAMIELRGVTKRFSGRTDFAALRSIDLQIAKGDVVAIVGPSGLREIDAAQPDGHARSADPAATSCIDGQPLADLDDYGLTRVRRDKIGFIFQFFNLLPSLTALRMSRCRCTCAAGRRSQASARRRAARRGRPRTRASSTCPTNCPEASASASPSPARSRSIRPSCSAMSRPGISTRRPAPRSSRSFAISTSGSTPPS